VIAGDLNIGPEKTLKSLIALGDTPKIYVLGNHEYWGHDFTTAWLEYRKVITLESCNTTLLEKSVYTIGDVTFLGATLWTSFRDGTELDAALMCMNDFGSIKEFSGQDIIEYHVATTHWLGHFLCKHQKEKTVVVTHHLPSFKCINKKYSCSAINGAFAADCDHLFEDDIKPKLWIHGHTHDSVDTTINGVPVICNPYGYSGYETNPNFSWTKIVEL
jgi:predicted phosphohydrolase